MIRDVSVQNEQIGLFSEKACCRNRRINSAVCIGYIIYMQIIRSERVECDRKGFYLTKFGVIRFSVENFTPAHGIFACTVKLFGGN